MRNTKKDPQGVLFSYRNSEIRTHDLLLPKQALYQTELYSVLVSPIIDKNWVNLKGAGVKKMKKVVLDSFCYLWAPFLPFGGVEAWGFPIFMILEPAFSGSTL